MLDKTLPYFNVIMRRPAGMPVVTPELGALFSWAEFGPGDQISWAGIETAVGEFPTLAGALEYFEKAYLLYQGEVSRRGVFVRQSNGDAVGTVTSWWNQTNDRRDPSVHWLAVRPEYQGRGLGKALVSWSIQRLISLEGDRDIWLHTQTWSHRAIAIYLKAGFAFVREGSFGGYPNDYEEAMSVLSTVLS